MAAYRVTKDLVCDVCGADGSVKTWRITRVGDGQAVSPDLCQEHSEFLESLFKMLPTAKRGQAKARRVLTEEQVKAQRRRK